MSYLIYAVFAGVIYFIYKIITFSDNSSVSVLETLQGQASEKVKVNPLSWLAPPNDTFLKKIRLYEKIRARLISAQLRWLPGQFFALKEVIVFFILILLYLLDIKIFLVYIVLVFFGFIFPDFWLSQRIRKRKDAIIRVLPETVDLLGLCVGAGLDFMSSVRWVIRKTQSNPMIDELKAVLDEINVGKSRSEALRYMAKRLDIPDVTSFVRTLLQADRMGTSIEEAFTIISDDSRMRRFQQGRRAALKAPIKMLIPLIFCIMPIIMIVVAGPIIIKFFTQGLFITQ